MVGIAGADTAARDLDTVVTPLRHEPWYEADRVSAGQYGITRFAHDRATAGTWPEGDRAGVVHSHVD